MELLGCMMMMVYTYHIPTLLNHNVANARKPLL